MVFTKDFFFQTGSLSFQQNQFFYANVFKRDKSLINMRQNDEARQAERKNCGGGRRI